MNNDTLITILLALLGLNFLVWLGLAIFTFVQVKKIFTRVNLLLESFGKISSTLAGTAVKVGAMAFGLLKGFKAVQSITTLGDLFDSDDGVDDGEEKGGFFTRGKKRK